MIDLDQRGQFEDVDRAGMLGRIEGLPDQMRDAWSVVQRSTLPRSHADAANVTVCGMGGSAIGGDLTRSIAESECRVPITVVRGYNLPRFVGPDSLVILTSFSGATEETLSTCDQALAVGARVVAITTGGRLAERAGSLGIPSVRFAYGGQPREAIGYSTLLILGVVTQLGYLADQTTAVESTALLLEEMRSRLGPHINTAENPAKRLAQRLFGKIGLIYGGGLMAEVARRWKSQLNENAKNWAFYEQLPELNHNAVEGYQFPADTSGRISLVMLSSNLNHPRINLREQITQEVVGRWGIPSERVEASGTTPLAHIMSATYFGDFVSYYLALVNDVDPTEIETLNFLKARLASL
ncbi:MAG: pgi-pmi [Chloroflexi bacterium]|nr:pgi-pmi [Chloroflexota bacterium]